MQSSCSHSYFVIILLKRQIHQIIYLINLVSPWLDKKQKRYRGINCLHLASPSPPSSSSWDHLASPVCTWQPPEPISCPLSSLEAAGSGKISQRTLVWIFYILGPNYHNTRISTLTLTPTPWWASIRILTIQSTLASASSYLSNFFLVSSKQLHFGPS